MLLDLKRPVRKKGISLTPLIDVVFILLLFFMLSSSFVHFRQIDVSAITDKKQNIDLNKPLMVKLLNDKGDFKIAGNIIAISSKSHIQQLVKQHPKAVFVIEAINGIKTQTMIHLLDVLKQAGAQSVTLAGING